ncbi:MAG: 3D-(3,5/4)-trihydroxycyclohexane-1,2-dione acylhydrolase (decyclizing) [Hamadaea sp.]|nr:3D-(3,5/4)-trihydroxycyclohexane-1,2-dione acylhydrolase (decyclizing) [Hamadaea sp.]
MRMTVAQATVAFLASQFTERDGVRRRLIAGTFGIFGHGNVAGLGQALLQAGPAMPYHQARNEQAMVHTGAAYARASLRTSTFACTTSIGPGATNLVTGAALATVNRLPVLLLPSDVFATRVASPVLQELEDPRSFDVSVNDTLRPVSRYWDRINRPEQLPAALLAACRVLTDPAETGAVTVCLPQDVQAEAYDFPDELFRTRVWRIRRPRPDATALRDAAELLRSAERPVIIAGGGVVNSAASEELAAFAEATGIPVVETQAGKGSLPHGRPMLAGSVGVTGSDAANALVRAADVVFGVGTRFSDFTTASRTLFADPAVRFVTLNVCGFDAYKLSSSVPLVGDARVGLAELRTLLEGWTAPKRSWRDGVANWEARIDAGRATAGPLTQTQVIGVVNDAAEPADIMVCAAGSMPGDLHRQWRAARPGQYHVEYGYSCMGYEIAGGLGAKLAAPDAEVFVLVGDGSYLMMAQELATAVAENIKLTVVLVDNRGFASIGALSQSVGGERLGTSYGYRSPTGGFDGGDLPVDLAANAASLGAAVLVATTVDELRSALDKARQSDRTTVVYARTALIGDPAPSSDAWWDVPVAQTGSTPSLPEAQAAYRTGKASQRGHY